MNPRSSKAVLTKHVFLIGFSGSGKSTIGPRLARLFGCVFVDTDQVIVRRHGKSIVRIFTEDGEAAFRRYESDVIADLLGRAQLPTVVALGGGAFQRSRNRALVRGRGLAVYLSCSVREIYRRTRSMTDRPLLRFSRRPGETMRQARLRGIAALLETRKPTYRQADVTVSTTAVSVSEAVRRIYREIQSRRADH